MIDFLLFLVAFFVWIKTACSFTSSLMYNEENEQRRDLKMKGQLRTS